MIPDMFIHRRSAIPESTRRSTMKQELICRLTNTSEMGSNEVRVGIIDKYAQKLINSEYSLEHTREFIVGGSKGYEKLLSPNGNHYTLAAGWNSNNRRVAKQRVKTN